MGVSPMPFFKNMGETPMLLICPTFNTEKRSAKP